MREILTAGLKKSAEEVGYAFFSGFGYRGGAVNRFPAVWVKPPKLVDVVGKEEGEMAYDVETVLMAAGMGLNAQGREYVWSQLERDAVEMCRRVAAKERVVRVVSPKCEPGEYAVTGNGEISMKLTFRVVLFFERNECSE